MKKLRHCRAVHWDELCAVLAKRLWWISLSTRSSQVSIRRQLVQISSQRKLQLITE